jgi:hypothetical protein
MIGIKLGNVGLNVALYTDTAVMDGSGGGSIAAWDDADGYFPENAMLTFVNTGNDPVEIGNALTPVEFHAGGNLVGLLFDGRSVTIDPGDTVWWPVPQGAALAGTTWAINAPLDSTDTVSITVTARPTEKALMAAGRALVADAVWDEALAGHFTAGSAGLALFLSKGLSQCQFVLDNTTYDASGLMLTGRIRIFPDAATATAATDGGTDEGEVAIVNITATGTNGLADFYKAIQP